MDLVSRFKKDYLNYFLGTIIPVIITAVSIPLFKQLLGPEGYGKFSISFNSVLLCTAILSGWVWQSILRYFPASKHKQSFVRQSFRISWFTQAVFVIPVFLVVWYLYRDFLLSLFFSLTLIISSLQFSLLAIGQSVFLSRKSIYYEFIRSVSYIVIALLLLKYTRINYMYSLFAAIIISYLLSFFYLYRQVKEQLLANHPVEGGAESTKATFRLFLLYGWPLSLWFVIALLISLVDKFFILEAAGPAVQGNYQAIFDFLSKSINVLITPVTISLFPLLTNAYQHGKKGEIKRLLTIIVGLEFAGLVAAGLLYWWFGAGILFALLKVPETADYKLMGLLVLAGSFLWQMAIVVQKRHELKFRSVFLLRMVVIAFVSQVLLYLVVRKTQGVLVYPAGYALSSLIYLLLVSVDFSRLRFNRQ